MIEKDNVYNMDCLDGLRLMEDEAIDLTVTSPPYDNLREYNGNIAQWSFDKFKLIANELYRVTKRGGGDSVDRERRNGKRQRDRNKFPSGVILQRCRF